MYLKKIGLLLIVFVLCLTRAAWAGEGHKQFADINEWLKAIPKSEYELKLINYGFVGDDWYAIFYSNDRRIAICSGSPNSGPFSIAYDICDENGKSVICFSEETPPQSIERIYKREDREGSVQHTVGFGWLRGLDASIGGGNLYFCLDTKTNKPVRIHLSSP